MSDESDEIIVRTPPKKEHINKDIVRRGKKRTNLRTGLHEVRKVNCIFIVKYVILMVKLGNQKSVNMAVLLTIKNYVVRQKTNKHYFKWSVFLMLHH